VDGLRHIRRYHIPAGLRRQVPVKSDCRCKKMAMQRMKSSRDRQKKPTESHDMVLMLVKRNKIIHRLKEELRERPRGRTNCTSAFIAENHTPIRLKKPGSNALFAWNGHRNLVLQLNLTMHILFVIIVRNISDFSVIPR